MPIKLNGSTSGYVQIDAPAVAGTTQITLPATTGGSFIVSDASGNVAVGANLTLSGTAARITGDFSNATVANRVALQTSTTNGNTITPFIPNGTGNNAGVLFYNNTDPTNSSRIDFRITATEASYTSTFSGTGSYLPMTFYTGGSERARIDTSGNIQVGGATVANTVGYVNSRTNTRAWARWTGSTVAIASSYNVSSVTRSSAGQYVVNFTTALSDANYAPMMSCSGDVAYNGYGIFTGLTSAPTTSSFAMWTKAYNGTAADANVVQIAVFGN